MSPQTHILIAGAGIAGPALAILLNRNGFKTTIVERADGLRTTGQQIDVVGPGIELIRLMGVEQAIRSRTVTDNGIKFVDANNKPFAELPASGSTASLVREIEIMRGDMADIFYNATKDQTEYIFNDRVASLTESKENITVHFKTSPPRTFDLVIAADGLSSRTREVAFGKSKEACIKSLNQWIALFLIPHSPEDGTWSRAFNAPGGLVAILRPDIERKRTSVYLGQGTPDVSVVNMPVDEQKAYIARKFKGVAQMGGAENFYVQQTAQVKMDSWSTGRTVLLGDAGYCPAPVSGLGTTMALVGAYVLAGCLITHEHDLPRALEQYEQELRPFVDAAQSLGPGVPGIATPHTEWGIWLLNSAIAAVGAGMGVSRVTGLGTVLGWLFWPVAWVLRGVGWLGGVERMPLPKYEKMK
jgi:2-polyprenyl-6-methoxyphenol hydroxylase-like FAD-dependent oxidoreductase